MGSALNGMIYQAWVAVGYPPHGPVSLSDFMFYIAIIGIILGLVIMETLRHNQRKNT